MIARSRPKNQHGWNPDCIRTVFADNYRPMTIRIPTVLVLGAGASEPYGYPIGERLRDLVTALPNDGLGGVKTNLIFHQLGHEREEWHTFVKILRHSGYRSVDRFLQKTVDFLEIGNRERQGQSRYQIQAAAKMVEFVDPGQGSQ